MEQAKAIINLKDGVIQLEGPVEFVRHYLDMYQSAIKGAGGSPEAVAAVAKREVAPRGRRRRIKRVSCIGAIREEIDAGFFSELKSAQEVKQRLAERGASFSDNSVRTSLRKLARDGFMDRVKEGRSARYRRRS